MGTVVEFKRPEPPPAKPEETGHIFTDRDGKKFITIYLEAFDGFTRYLADDSKTAAQRETAINQMRSVWNLCPLGGKH